MTAVENAYAAVEWRLKDPERKGSNEIGDEDITRTGSKKKIQKKD